MQVFFDSLKNLLLNMTSVGWAPWPMLITAIFSVGARLFYEDDILEVNTMEAKKQQVKIKKWVIGVAYVVSVVSCYAFDFPKSIDEHLQIYCFSVLNIIIGYVSYSIYQLVDVKGKLKGAINAKFGGGNPPANP